VDNNKREIFVDELDSFMFGACVTKLSFSSFRQGLKPDDQTVLKEPVVTLAIPTAALLEACKAIVESSLNNKAAIIDGSEQANAKMRALIQEIGLGLRSNDSATDDPGIKGAKAAPAK